MEVLLEDVGVIHIGEHDAWASMSLFKTRFWLTDKRNGRTVEFPALALEAGLSQYGGEELATPENWVVDHLFRARQREAINELEATLRQHRWLTVDHRTLVVTCSDSSSDRLHALTFVSEPLVEDNEPLFELIVEALGDDAQNFTVTEAY